MSFNDLYSYSILVHYWSLNKVTGGLSFHADGLDSKLTFVSHKSFMLLGLNLLEAKAQTLKNSSG